MAKAIRFAGKEMVKTYNMNMMRIARNLLSKVESLEKKVEHAVKAKVKSQPPEGFLQTDHQIIYAPVEGFSITISEGQWDWDKTKNIPALEQSVLEELEDHESALEINSTLELRSVGGLSRCTKDSVRNIIKSVKNFQYFHLTVLDTSVDLITSFGYEHSLFYRKMDLLMKKALMSVFSRPKQELHEVDSSTTKWAKSDEVTNRLDALKLLLFSFGETIDREKMNSKTSERYKLLMWQHVLKVG